MPLFSNTKAMLPESLVTNEVKDSAGAELEFKHVLYANDGSKRIYAKVGEVYNLQHRLSIAHQVLGQVLKCAGVR